MLVRVGFSADPDDAFMFWGLAVHELLSRAEAVGAYDVPVRVQFVP